MSKDQNQYLHRVALPNANAINGNTVASIAIEGSEPFRVVSCLYDGIEKPFLNTDNLRAIVAGGVPGIPYTGPFSEFRVVVGVPLPIDGFHILTDNSLERSYTITLQSAASV